MHGRGKCKVPYSAEQTGLTRSEEITSLFQPDTFLPAQYFDDRRSKTLLEPEKRLMLAILEDAIDCFQDNHSARHGKGKRLFDEAQEWIFETRDDWVFGFESICSALRLNSEYIRRGLVQWREKQLSKQHRAPLWNGPRKMPEGANYRITSEALRLSSGRAS